ncbi:unnamed protein product [Durusdinium trenchii]|uniref:Uncharacterized protein n=1 Tax=Durusdinium trenchii TaxID=1381693 RepID=A0ABP0Q9Z7_9DINO
MSRVVRTWIGQLWQQEKPFEAINWQIGEGEQRVVKAASRDADKADASPTDVRAAVREEIREPKQRRMNVSARRTRRSKP